MGDLRAYIGYDDDLGPGEGAVLIFAHTAREAKKVFWKSCSGEMVEEYINARAEWLKDRPWLFLEIDLEKSAKGEAHVIDSPRSCSTCLQWGGSPIGNEGFCDSCADEK